MIRVLAPVAGEVKDLATAGDPVFAMLGAGVTLWPDSGRLDVRAPIAGAVMALQPHAFGIDDGAGGILVHLGVNTAKLPSAFTLHVARGDHVDAGQLIATWDRAATDAAGASPAVVVMALGRQRLDECAGDTVQTGELLFEA